MQIGYEFNRSCSDKKSNGTPMKMLIAQEMSKEMDFKKPASVVAKLMGLDALPAQEPNSRMQQMQGGVHHFQEHRDCKDVYEVREKFPKTNYIKQKSLRKGRYTEKNPNATNMDLVRQKFIEAKHLATDEKLRHSKEFQDALEVLSSNKDLFLKLLQEPDTLITQNLYELQSIPPSPQMQHITVLRPSKTMKNNRAVLSEKSEINGWDRNKSGLNHVFTNEKDDRSTQPTRIVVLKPSPGKTHGVKAVVSPPSVSPRLLQGKDFCEQSEVDEARCSREVAKEITRQVRTNLGSHHREETWHSFGDESSFNRSKNECIEEGNLSDSEYMMPTSRYSQDYNNRFGSPPYSSSFSEASYYPESSVCREAKKRLSERWAMMASNRSVPGQIQIQRSSSTLGEMLALSHTKKFAKSAEEENGGISVLSSRSCVGEQNLRDLTICLSGSLDNEGEEDFSSNLPRSRSVPVSSTSSGARLNVESPEPKVGKLSVLKEVEKPKSGKSSFKGKVSSLFFSRNKKPNKEKSWASSPLVGSQETFQSAVAGLPGVSDQDRPSPEKIRNDFPECVTINGPEGGPSVTAGGSSSMTSSPASAYLEPKTDMFSHEIASSSLAKSEMPGNRSENQDLLTSISVLKTPFEDDNTTPQPSGNVESLKSNLIAKSPPIESLARSLSSDNTCSGLPKPNPLDSSTLQFQADEEQEWLLFIQTLLSSAALDIEDHPNAFFARWHSLDSPLDPLLVDKFINVKSDKEKWHEAKHRQWRSNQKLMFDCVNAALIEITGYASNAGLWPRVGAKVTPKDVWSRVREWFYSEAMSFLGESGDKNSLIVERVVKKEVVGGGWKELMRLEFDDLKKEIEGKMMEELVEEALFEFTGMNCLSWCF